MILVTGTLLGRQEACQDSPPWMAAGSRHDLDTPKRRDGSSLTIGRNPQ
jgi:hypothetical protein